VSRRPGTALAMSKNRRVTDSDAPVTASVSHEIRSMTVADLKPAPYNARRIDAAAMAGLSKSIERFGNVQPIVWNRRSGFVVGGHQRLKVLRANKVKTTDVRFHTTGCTLPKRAIDWLRPAIAAASMRRAL
jgi:hypothetical protein